MKGVTSFLCLVAVVSGTSDAVFVPSVRTCASTDCRPGFTCIDFPAGPSCLPVESTCAVRFCGPGTQCVEHPNGASCQPVKKGNCPAVCGLNGCPRDTGPCSASCKGDNDCPHNRKCCRTFCGGPQCVAPDFPFLACSNTACLADASCKILDCPADKRCVDSTEGAQCLPFTPLSCARVDCRPGFTCIDFPAGPSCLPVGSTCAVVRCGTDTQCVEDPNGASCQPVSPGVCPATPSSLCVVSCKGDVQCSRGQKCCGTTCGGQVCTDPILQVFTCGGGCIDGIPCAIVDCFSPTSVCVETPGGNAECRIRIKEGVCPPAFAVERNPRDPSPGCVSDPNCPRNLKCCPTQNDGSVCVDPLPRPTCASTDCILPSVCVEPPGGNAECRILVKEGACPPSFAVERNPGTPGCVNDPNCPRDLKCCPTVNDGSVCVDPLPRATCASTLCVVGTVCVETPEGTECRPGTKDGVCPPPFDVGMNSNGCDRDPECPGNRKCCPTGVNGGCVCVDPLPRPTCASTLCSVGTVCVETPAGPECRPGSDKPGVCPSEFIGPVRDAPCNRDADCRGDEKCCTALLGGDALITACADPVVPSRFVCSLSSCIDGIPCAIVDCFDSTTICVETPGGNAECRDNPCALPKEPGPCEAFIPRYYYNQRDNECQRFIYGGCRGNANNFQDIASCNNACTSSTSNPCTLPKEPGPCYAFLPRYYYNQRDNECQRFIYGGCRGNANNFQDIASCNNACTSSTSNICLLPAVAGPCRASIPSYYYDAKTKRCKNFTYGGCGGNENRFTTKSACEMTCGRY